MKRRTVISTITIILIAVYGGVNAYAALEISFVEPPTLAHGATIEGSFVPVEVSIKKVGAALVNVTFYWDSTSYTIYDNPLVLMYNFNNVSALGESGAYFVDLSTHNNDGVGLNFDGDEIVAGQSTEYGNAVDFDGIDDYIRIEDSPELNVIAFTIAFWFNARYPAAGTQSLVARGEDLDSDIAQWVIELDDPQNPDTVQLWIEQGDDRDWHYGLNTRPSANTWYHYAVTRSSDGTVKVYLNGIKENEWANQVDPEIVPTPITVGARTNRDPADVQDYFDGTIDELRIWDTPLSEGQVAELYMSNLRKHAPGSWTLYVNQSSLASGTHTYSYQASASDSSGTSTTEQRSVTVTAPEVTPEIIKGPYLQQVTENSIVIMWETDIAAGSRVETNQHIFEETALVTIHEVLLDGLVNASYNYTVTSGTATSPASTFATAPGADQSFRFVAYGNTRSNASAHKDVITAIINSAPDLVIHTGDLVYNGNDYGQWGEQFFGPCYDLMINTPLLPVLGNHEYSSGQTLFFDFFSLPNNEEWFAYTYGGVRFIGLNTCVNYAPGGSQYNWLVDELQSIAYTSATWHIVYFHHPPYTSASGHSDDANVQQHLVPLFEENGVDMVFNGHSHVYERYFHNGIYYIVTGGGGAPLSTLQVDNKEPIRQVGETTFHHCVIDVTSSSLTLKAWYNDGSYFDTITITRTPWASNPNPEDLATNVPVEAVLSWKAGIDAVSHDVFFGTAASPPFIQNQDGTSYGPDTMDYETTYYWRIDEFDGSTTHQGDVWSFTTEVLVPELPWSDGFESGSFADGGWTTSGNASVSSKADHYGIYGAEIKGTSWIEKAVSTVGFSNININYFSKTKGLDNGENLYVEWYDGSNWHELEATQDNDWRSPQNLICGTRANDNDAFKVRFRTNASNSAEYAYVDDVEISSTPSGPDVTAPTPDPMTWAVVPYATGSTSISMTATTASDPSGVEYYFDETSGNPGGSDSGWQDSRTYEDTGLQSNTTYTYQVKARDKSTDHYETELSSAASATTTTSTSTGPGQATNPIPSHGDTNVNRKTVKLEWMAGSDAASHNVYLGTSGDLGQEDFKGNQTSTSYISSFLRKKTTYYWRIDEVNSDGTREGGVWSFTTL